MVLKKTRPICSVSGAIGIIRVKFQMFFPAVISQLLHAPLPDSAPILPLCHPPQPQTPQPEVVGEHQPGAVHRDWYFHMVNPLVLL
jgi:hypothetical protein